MKLYLHVNETIYDHPAKKISFALLFMNEGDAASWKEQLLEEVMAKDPFDLGMWDMFEKNLKMKTLRMGNGSIEEHNAKFKMIVTKSELDETSPAVIDYYRETLSFPLQRRILSLENPPKTLKEWYNWAAKLDNNWRKMQRVLGRSQETNDQKDFNGKKKEEPKKRFHFTCQDPNAMDIDSLTIERRGEMMKKRLCFNCEEPGHLSRDCPNKKKGKTLQSPPSYTPPKPKKLATKEWYSGYVGCFKN